MAAARREAAGRRGRRGHPGRASVRAWHRDRRRARPARGRVSADRRDGGGRARRSGSCVRWRRSWVATRRPRSRRWRRDGPPRLPDTPPLALASPAAATVPKEPLGHRGRWITDAKGRVVMFHGAAVTPDGFGDKALETVEEAGFKKADASLSRRGFNLVRLAAFHGAYEREPGQFTESYIEELRAHAAAARPPRDLHASISTRTCSTLATRAAASRTGSLRTMGIRTAAQAGFPATTSSIRARTARTTTSGRTWPRPTASASRTTSPEVEPVAAALRGTRACAGYDLLDGRHPAAPRPPARTRGYPPGGFDRPR